MIENYLDKIKQRLNVVVLHAVVYTRYSSDMQRGESIDAQIRLIRKWSDEHSIVIDKIYADEAQSAKSDERKQFQQMIADSKKQKDWQLVLVHKLDRFARNRMDSAAYRVELRKNKKYLISTTEQFDDTPESCMLEGIIESMAEFYSKNLAREVMKGLTENALKGKTCGGTPPLGYDLDERKYYKINEFEAQAVKLIFQLFLEGKTYGEIISKLNTSGYRTKCNRLFSRNSLYEILRNEKYKGILVYNKTQSRDEITGKRSGHRYKSDEEVIRVDGVIPQIVSPEDWDDVQLILNSRKKAFRNNAKETYLLSGKIRCGKCGGSYDGRRSFNSCGTKYIYYACNGKRNPNYKCNNNSIQRDWIESYMINIIDNYIHHLSKAQKQNIYQLCFDSAQSSKKADISILNQRLNSLNKELSRIVDVITITNSTTLIEKLTDLEQQKAEIQLRIKVLSQEKGKILSKQKINLLLTKIKKMLKEKSVPQLKELMDLIVNEIIVNDKDVIVYLNIPIVN